MVHANVIVNAALTLLAAGIYLFIGARLWTRPLVERARVAGRSFSIWWLFLAASTTLGIINGLVARAGLTDLRYHVAMSYLGLAVLCVALWGLLYYLAFLFTGRSGILVPITAFYVAYYLLLVYYVTFSEPTHVVVEGLSAQIQYAEQIEGPLFAVVLILLVTPQILGAIAYGTLFFRVRDATQRYRIALVSASIVFWFGSALVAAGLELSERFVHWPFVARLIGLGATALLLMAYFPPRWTRSKWGIASIRDVGEEVAGDAN